MKLSWGKHVRDREYFGIFSLLRNLNTMMNDVLVLNNIEFSIPCFRYQVISFWMDFFSGLC